MSVLTRPVSRSDEGAWRVLWKGYLDFYKTEIAAEQTTRLFEALLRGDPHFAIVAELGGEVVGFVHALPHASTWSAQGYCYLEDLFVAPAARGSGAARALVEAVYQEADRRALERVYWITDSGNLRARKLYDKLATLSDFVQYRR